MISVKQLIVNKQNRVFVDKDLHEEPASLVAKSRIKHPVLDKPVNNIYIVNKGEFMWDRIKLDYLSVKSKMKLTMNDLFLIDWEMSY